MLQRGSNYENFDCEVIYVSDRRSEITYCKLRNITSNEINTIY